MSNPTPTINLSLPQRLADFSNLLEALEYAALGETGFNFYSARGKLDRVLEYSRLCKSAKEVAKYIRGTGAKQGDRIALLAETTPEFLVSFFACQYAGVIPVPMPTPLAFGRRDGYVDQIHNQLESAGASMIIGSDDYLSLLKLAASNTAVKFIGSLLELQAGQKVSNHSILQPEDLCILQYSSGSTRFPKGVGISHNNLMVNCTAMNFAVRNSPRERAVSWLPFYHDMGLIGFMIGCMAGQTSVDYLSPESFARRPLTWLKIISENSATMSYGPSFGYELCTRRHGSSLGAAAEGLDLKSWRVAGIGGEMVKPQVMLNFAKEFKEYGFAESAFNPAYGLAEATLGVSFTVPGKGMTLDHISKFELGENNLALSVPNDGSGVGRTFVACGVIVQDHKVEIRDKNGRVLPDRSVGQVFFAGPSVMKGYYNDQLATDEYIIDGWLNTGDLGYFVDGELILVGRSKDVMIVNGRNYWPQDIEWTVEKISGINSGDAAAFVIEAENEQDAPIVLVQCRVSDKALRMALIEEVKTKVYEQIGLMCDVILVLPRTLPKTSSGKLSRGKAKADYVRGDILSVADGSDD